MWFTDYPIKSFVDIPVQKDPKRKVKIISLERDPYVLVDIFDVDTKKTIRESIKSFYIYIEENEE